MHRQNLWKFILTLFVVLVVNVGISFVIVELIRGLFAIFTLLPLQFVANIIMAITFFVSKNPDKEKVRRYAVAFALASLGMLIMLCIMNSMF